MATFESEEAWNTFVSSFNLTNDHIEGLRQFGSKYVFSLDIVILLSVLYGVISIVAIIGNILVITVVLSNRQMQTVTNVFIVNLAFSDVFLGLFVIPFQFLFVISRQWYVADILCPIAPFVKIVSVNVCVLSLTLIAIDRYIAVVYPLRAGFHKRVAVIALALIWGYSIGASIPTAIVYRIGKVFVVKDLIERPTCIVSWPSDEFYTVYSVFTCLAQYAFPLLIITFTYARITCKIQRQDQLGIQQYTHRTSTRGRNQKKVVKMLIIVVSLFALCWLPLQAYNVLVPFYKEEITGFKHIHIIWLCFNWLAMSNSCYNPFIYGLLNEKFKKEFRQIFSRCTRSFKHRRNSNNETNKYWMFNSQSSHRNSSSLTLRRDENVRFGRRNEDNVIKLNDIAHRAMK